MTANHKTIWGFALLAAWMLLPAPLLAQEQAGASRYDRALAAGYKAQFLCSGQFAGGKTVDQIEADELTGIYETLAPIVPTLTAEIDREGRSVRVAFAEAMPPRVARFNPLTGCTAMPIGWSEATPGDPLRPLPFGLAAQGMTRLAPGALDDRPWPLGDAEASDPRIMMITPMDRLVDSAFEEAAFGGKTSGVVIVHKGKIIQERYKPGHDLHTGQRTWSVAKSIAGTFIGYVQQRGHHIPPQPLADFAAPNDPRAAITLDQLMRMASGLHSDTAGNRTDDVYLGGGSAAAWTTQWPLLYPPNSRFRYANNDILLATMAARDAAPDVHPHQLFDALGMTRTFAETDWQGNYILSSQVWTTARDLARLGMLYEHDGVWPYAQGDNGQPLRLLPVGWRDYVSLASGPQPDGEFGYGATFWLLNRSAGIPTDAIGMFGNRGQFVVIIPSLDLVVVRRGYDTASDRFDIAAFIAAVVEQISP